MHNRPNAIPAKAMKNSAHRSVLKQQNKKFKGSSSGASKKKASGRVEKTKKIGSGNFKALNKIERRNQSKISQKAKNERFSDMKRIFQGSDAAPKIVSVVPLGSDTDADAFIRDFVGNEEFQSQSPNVFYSPTHRQRLQFLSCHRKLNLWQIMDFCIASDFVVFLLSGSQGCILQDEWGNSIARSLMLQGIPSAIFCIQSAMAVEVKDEKFRSQLKAYALCEAKKLAPETGKIFFADSQRDLQEISRHVFSNYPKGVTWKANYPHIVVDEWQFMQEEPQSCLIVSGFCRGKSLNIKNWVHIPMLGDFQVEALESENITLTKESFGGVQPVQEPKNTEFFLGKNEDSMDFQEHSGDDQTSLQQQEEDPVKVSSIVVKVPKGTSSYQAAWYVNQEQEQEESSQNQSEEEEEEYETITLNSNNEESSRNEMEIEKEAKDLSLFKSSLHQADDEIELPDDKLARHYLAEYRGVKSLKHSKWDEYEDLPEEYANVFHFQNFKLSQKTALTEESSLDVSNGTRVSLKIMRVSPEEFARFYSNFQGKTNNFVVFGLLRHENNPTVCHASISKCSESGQEENSLKNNDEFIISVGFRRYQTKVLLSQFGAGEAHKMIRCVADSSTIVASFYAQVAYPPLPVALYSTSASLLPIATGSLLNPDPFRVVAERVTLSGSPFKIFRKTAVVRFMFFHPEDVNYFKPIELVTKSGKVGRILESLGTHGYMKCQFDKQIQQNDIIYLHLYRRVFPQPCTRYLHCE